MVDHATRKTTTDRLEDVIARLSNHQSSLFDKDYDLVDKYSELSSKVDSILNRLHLLTPNHNHSNLSAQFSQRNPVKLDIP